MSLDLEILDAAQAPRSLLRTSNFLAIVKTGLTAFGVLT